MPLRWQPGPKRMLLADYSSVTAWEDTYDLNASQSFTVSTQYDGQATRTFNFTHEGQSYSKTYTNCLKVTRGIKETHNGATSSNYYYYIYYAPNVGCVAVHQPEGSLYEGSAEEWWHLLDYTP